jgi:hypothetical protein
MLDRFGSEKTDRIGLSDLATVGPSSLFASIAFLMWKSHFSKELP